MRFILAILLLISSSSFSQNKAARKFVELRKIGNIDSMYLKTTHHKGDYWFERRFYLKEAFSKTVYIYKDTIHEKNDDYEVGMITLDTVYQFLHTRIGLWNFYYSNGNKKAQGNFQSQASISCGPHGFQLNISSYKTGDWNFWYPDGRIMASGRFLNKKEKSENECVDGDYIMISITTPKWNFFDSNGNKIKNPSPEMKEIINTTGWSYLNL